jgi:hypothetical protein
MDPTHFDRVVRRLGEAASRRNVLGAILTAAGLGVVGEHVAAKPKHRARRSGRLRKQAQSGFRDCPKAGPGQNLSNCDFSGVQFPGKSLRGANLSGTLFDDANLCSADLRGANLQNADFRFANLTRADFRGTNLGQANTAGALFCQTVLPSGKLDNSGCPEGTIICCFNSQCPFDQTCVNGGCAPSGDCPAGQVKRLNGSCAVPCNDDGDCAAGCECVSQRLEHPDVCMNIGPITGGCANRGTSVECPGGSGCDGFLCHPLCVPATA